MAPALLSTDIRNVFYEFMKPNNTLLVPLAYYPVVKRSKYPQRPIFHPYIALTQVNKRFRKEFRPYMESITYIVDLESLGLFMNDWDIIEKEHISKIVTGFDKTPCLSLE
ncbi:hypothetical protein GQ44DRAFT_780698 [Phaeosphaeriaceae sp. PMI808]|nr:hypothetical protein GQ44DRAFT_780698 [Phaeosphaeriaceae sp. PMI808]